MTSPKQPSEDGLKFWEDAWANVGCHCEDGAGHGAAALGCPDCCARLFDQHTASLRSRLLASERGAVEAHAEIVRLRGEEAELLAKADADAMLLSWAGQDLARLRKLLGPCRALLLPSPGYGEAERKRNECGAERPCSIHDREDA